MENSFLAFIEESIKKNWDLDALTDYKGATLQYKDVARKIEKLHILLQESGVKPGDKVALCGRNSSHWGVAFLSILTYGAVAVPILHEFKPDNVHNIVNHSDARLLFVGDMAWENLNEAEMPSLEGIILMTDFTLLVCRYTPENILTKCSVRSSLRISVANTSHTAGTILKNWP